MNQYKLMKTVKILVHAFKMKNEKIYDENHAHEDNFDYINLTYIIINFLFLEKFDSFPI